MAGRIGTVARAFELAQSGDCDSIGAIEKRLIAESFEDVVAHLSGPLIRSQLRHEMTEVTKARILLTL